MKINRHYEITTQDQAISAGFVTVQGVQGWIILGQNHKCIVSDKSTDGRNFLEKINEQGVY